MRDNSGKIILALLAGASAGVITGLLMAPDTGEATRTGVKKWATKLSKDLEKNLQAGLDEIKNMSGDVMDNLNKHASTLTGNGDADKGSAASGKSAGTASSGTSSTGAGSTGAGSSGAGSSGGGSGAGSTGGGSGAGSTGGGSGAGSTGGGSGAGSTGGSTGSTSGAGSSTTGSRPAGGAGA